MAAAAAGMDAAEPKPADPLGGRRRAPQTYRFRKGEWNSFRCGACGHTVQLSPSFSGSQVDCNKCRARINIA
jgi:DNA-directed RNA polymerase subunit RPC12/RpoP